MSDSWSHALSLKITGESMVSQQMVASIFVLLLLPFKGLEPEILGIGISSPKNGHASSPHAAGRELVDG